jgi:hypothetical protein
VPVLDRRILLFTKVEVSGVREVCQNLEIALLNAEDETMAPDKLAKEIAPYGGRT